MVDLNVCHEWNQIQISSVCYALLLISYELAVLAFWTVFYVGESDCFVFAASILITHLVDFGPHAFAVEFCILMFSYGHLSWS